MIGALCCVLLLCSCLGGARPSQGGRCVGDLCAFQAVLDFKGAEDACLAMTGTLWTLSPGEDDKLLTGMLSGSSGALWLDSTNKTGQEGGCPSVFLTEGQEVKLRWALCSEPLDGFLCLYGPGQVCAPLQPGGSAQVEYTVMTGFDIVDSETLPPGTIGTAGSLDSKHLCFSNSWIRAPWNCEVLNGGCAETCVSEPHTCGCPQGQLLQPNRVSCVRNSCADCAHKCQTEDYGYVCKCDPGYRLAPDGKGCLDVDECAEGPPCTAEGEECENTQGGYKCSCSHGFDVDDGVCVNVTICSYCEHMDCRKLDGVYRCACRDGFEVSRRDPTKCEKRCTERDCPATCHPNPVGPPICFCPNGYVRDVSDISNTTNICTDINECEMGTCDHLCVNTLGSFTCVCLAGFELRDQHRCVLVKQEDGDAGSGSGSGTLEQEPTEAAVTPASLQPVAVPSYIQTGSILGITVFMVLCAVLLALITRHAVRRCGSFDFSTFKHPDLDLYYLQQVTTETYKRLSLDRQLKQDQQRL